MAFDEMKGAGQGRVGHDPRGRKVARYVTLNASHHKEQQYIGLGVGI